MLSPRHIIANAFAGTCIAEGAAVRVLYFTILVAVLVLAWLAHLTGIPIFINASLFAICLAGMVLL